MDYQISIPIVLRIVRKNGYAVRTIKEHNQRRAAPKGWAAMVDVYKYYKCKAKKDGMKFDISKTDFHTTCQKPCFYCGDEPRNIRKGQKFNGPFKYNGLDRLDNNLGYILSNVVPCCKICNIAKNNLTIQEFFDWANRFTNKWIETNQILTNLLGRTNHEKYMGSSGR